MTTVQQAPTPRQAGAEPIPGYRLIEPLGQGGFGEVWKCEAPGGVFKAIKFVRDGESGPSLAAQELESLQRVKTLRHPFILSMDRIELVDDVLLIIMELADHSLDALCARYCQEGRPGVPREELLDYLLEAAEALDWMNFEHGLQHLDVKPHNLFLVSNHVKVADFGLVSSLGDDCDGAGQPRKGGLTPLYSAPELLRGSLSRHSDQYSLAVVYQQLLTGTVPFWHTNIYELMMQHLSAAPSLAALPEGDRPVVARALSKVPEHRFPCCQEFLQALLGGPRSSSGLRRSGAWRRVLGGPRQEVGEPPRAPSIPSSADQKTQMVQGPSAANSPGSPGPVPEEQDRQDTGLSHTTTPSPAAPLAHDLFPPSRPKPTPRDLQPPTAPTHSVGEPAASGPEAGVADLFNPQPGAGGFPAPTAIVLRGYRFVSCMQQGPLGDLWRAEDASGQPRRALCLLNFVRYDARLIAHLQALRDPALPGTEVHWSPAERLVILTESFEQTLRERFDQVRAEGRAGLPRADLLRLLRSAAEALDALYARHGLQHLGIHPRNLLIDGEKLWIADFGIIPLVWLPTGRSAAQLNSRYAAPELLGRRPSRTADQYSLALIYAEMLTGVHPRPQRSSTSGSGLNRRPPLPRRSSPVNRAVRTDLDLLPARDRDVVLKALSSDPERRYESCTAFIEALEQVGEPEVEPDLYHTLPPVIPYTSLLGEPAGPNTILPSVDQLVTELTRAADPQAVLGPHNARYFVHPDGVWEYRCPLQLFPGAMLLKLEAFRHYWRARVVKEEGDSFRLHIDVEAARSFWERYMKAVRHIEVDIHVEPLVGPQTRLTEATVRVSCPGRDRDQTTRILATMAPPIFDSVRLYFQTAQEQRARERWPLTQPVHVYPVLPNLDVAEVIEGVCQNISFGGIRFRLPQLPPTEQMYLHLYAAASARDYALLARTARVQQTSEGFEIGAMLLGKE